MSVAARKASVMSDGAPGEFGCCSVDLCLSYCVQDFGNRRRLLSEQESGGDATQLVERVLQRTTKSILQKYS